MLTAATFHRVRSFALLLTSFNWHLSAGEAAEKLPAWCIVDGELLWNELVSCLVYTARRLLNVHPKQNVECATHLVLRMEHGTMRGVIMLIANLHLI